MAGQNQYLRLLKLLEKFDRQNLGVEALKQIVRLNLASEEKTIVKYLQMARAAGMITEVSPYLFEVNLSQSKKYLEKEPNA